MTTDASPGQREGDGLAQVADLVRLVDDLEEQIAADEKALNEKRRRLDRVLEEDLPELFFWLHRLDGVIVDGRKVTLDRDNFDYSIAGEKAGPAIAWLEKNGHGAMVKRQIVATLGRDSDKLAALVMETLAEVVSEDAISTQTKVEPSTLRAWLREMVREHRRFPDDLFAFTPRPCAKIAKRKQRRKDDNDDF